jgi:hypothetical protein
VIFLLTEAATFFAASAASAIAVMAADKFLEIKALTMALPAAAIATAAVAASYAIFAR